MIEVLETADKKWGLYINGTLIGTSKARFDADHAKVVLNLWRNQRENPKHTYVPDADSDTGN